MAQNEQSTQHQLAPLGSRLKSLVACVVVALASGTTYGYSIFVPQLVENSRLPVSVTAQLSLFITLGTGLGGFPAGIIIDSVGPRWSVALGALCTMVSFKIIHWVFTHQSQNLVLLLFAMTFVGFGSIMSSYACLKVAAANFPNHRGTCASMPVSAYALSAMVYSSIAVHFYDGDTAGFLRFVYTVPPVVCFAATGWIELLNRHPLGDEESADLLGDEESASPLLSPGASVAHYSSAGPAQACTEKHPVWDHHFIRLFRQRIFIKYYIILLFIQGIGQMYIYSVGFMVVVQVDSRHAGALLAPEAQAIEVSAISIMSFLGRFTCGPISDFIKHKLRLQRFWCVFLASVLMAAGHKAVSNADSIEQITVCSCLIGYSFGFIFGAYPAMIADSFGTAHFSTIWGFMTSGSLVSIGVLSKLFADVLESHTDPDGLCLDGVQCYRDTFVVTEWLAVAVGCLILVTIYMNYKGGQATCRH